MTDDHMQVLLRIEASQTRTEAKLDQLLQALAEGDETQQTSTQPLEPSDPK